MGDPVGIGFHLPGDTNHTSHPLFFCRRHRHTVLLLHLGSHLDTSGLVVPFMAFFFFLMAIFAFFMGAGLFILVASFFIFGMFHDTAFTLGSEIVNAAA